MQIKLSNVGYDIYARVDGTTGLAAVGPLHPDLVVLDWMIWWPGSKR